jgi:hypothetical protein
VYCFFLGEGRECLGQTGRSADRTPGNQAALDLAVRKIAQIAYWAQGNLPVFCPPIVSQAAYIVVVQSVMGNPISLKALIGSLGCSEAGLRKPLQRLLDEGWVVIENDPGDRRVRRVIATNQLLAAVLQLADQITPQESKAEG